MAAQYAKERMVELLDRRAFEPVLRAKPDQYPQSKRDELEAVQRATRSEQQRFHSRGSANKIYRMFEDDLSSDAARDVRRRLRALDLPTIQDVRGEFESMAQGLGVRGSVGIAAGPQQLAPKHQQELQASRRSTSARARYASG